MGGRGWLPPPLQFIAAESCVVVVVFHSAWIFLAFYSLIPSDCINLEKLRCNIISAEVFLSSLHSANKRSGL